MHRLPGATLLVVVAGTSLAVVLLVSFTRLRRRNRIEPDARRSSLEVATQIPRYHVTPPQSTKPVTAQPPHSSAPPEPPTSTELSITPLPSISIHALSAPIEIPATECDNVSDSTSSEQLHLFKFPLPWCPPTIMTLGPSLSPRSMSMEARKGSACTLSTDGTVSDDDMLGGRAEADNATFSGIGGQFSL